MTDPLNEDDFDGNDDHIDALKERVIEQEDVLSNIRNFLVEEAERRQASQVPEYIAEVEDLITAIDTIKEPTP